MLGPAPEFYLSAVFFIILERERILNNNIIISDPPIVFAYPNINTRKDFYLV
jgi:hypothetical protein